MAKDTPSFDAFTVIKREGQEDFWQKIGAAFAHADGKGMNLILQALPVPQDGQVKIVLRQPKEERGERPQRENSRRDERSDVRRNGEYTRARPSRQESRGGR